MPVNFNVARVVPTVSRAKASSVARKVTQNLSGKQISVARKELLEGLRIATNKRNSGIAPKIKKTPQERKIAKLFAMYKKLQYGAEYKEIPVPVMSNLNFLGLPC